MEVSLPPSPRSLYTLGSFQKVLLRLPHANGLDSPEPVPGPLCK